MMVLLLLLAGLACLVATASFIWLAIVAFKQHILWGIAVLLVPLAPIVFAIMHWHDSKKPFLINLASSVLAIMLFFGAGGAAFMMAARMAPEAMADAGVELEPDTDAAHVLAEATPPSAPETEPVPMDQEPAVRQDSTGDDRDALAITLQPTSPLLEVNQAGMAPPLRRARRSAGDEIPLDEIDSSYVGEVLRVVSKDGLNANARLTAVTPTVLSFEREVGIGSVTFDLKRHEIETVYLTER